MSDTTVPSVVSKDGWFSEINDLWPAECFSKWMRYCTEASITLFVAGWVREVLVFVASADKRVMTAKVNHSQKLREKPLMSWVICEVSGKAVSCHCNCMAGLGESCSHVAYLLWAIEAGVQLRDSLTVMQKKAYWLLPNSRKDVPYVAVEQINF
uniref:SWIM-type domain-containing protein n=1 Tax=Amphimedon queenslandica TaxID=400682 RepID=A0A1X7T0Y7_AMPQE